MNYSFISNSTHKLNLEKIARKKKFYMQFLILYIHNSINYF